MHRTLIIALGLALVTAGSVSAGERGGGHGGGYGGGAPGCGSCGGGHGGYNGNINVNVNASASASAYAGASSYINARGYSSYNAVRGGGYTYGGGGGGGYDGYTGAGPGYGGGYALAEPVMAGPSAPFGYVVQGFGRDYYRGGYSRTVETSRYSQRELREDHGYREDYGYRDDRDDGCDARYDRCEDGYDGGYDRGYEGSGYDDRAHAETGYQSHGERYEAYAYAYDNNGYADGYGDPRYSASPPIRPTYYRAPDLRVSARPVSVPPQVVYIEGPPVYVDAPPVHIPPAQIYVEAPDVRVRPSEVTVAPAEVHFTPPRPSSEPQERFDGPTSAPEAFDAPALEADAYATEGRPYLSERVDAARYEAARASEPGLGSNYFQ